MHFFITGHTGFKGAWLILLLRQKNHLVSGFSLDPEKNSLFEISELSKMCQRDFRGDIRDYSSIEEALNLTRPDVVIHLAAQSLVSEGYLYPKETFETNVLGTMNVVRASQNIETIKARLVVTTDKVYKNKNQVTGYKESDELGGQDPYSASKSMADIFTQSWVKSFNIPPTAIARAGNVIGGGDFGRHRLIPDLIASYTKNEVPKLRYPNAVRPWQHVLDCLNGYLHLVDYLIGGGEDLIWNFGPPKTEFFKVHEVAEEIGRMWSRDVSWELDKRPRRDESELLILDSSKARKELGWSEKFDFNKSVEITSEWYELVNQGISPIKASEITLSQFIN